MTHKVVKFTLINDDLHREFGTVSFNGKFVFELSPDIDVDTWQKIGIIPLPDGAQQVRKVELSDDLFYYLNSRLPQRLRQGTIAEKLQYIKESGLRVASDGFRLQPV